jgi:6-phosphogluconolactonase (cycloisomerase 2 family)
VSRGVIAEAQGSPMTLVMRGEVGVYVYDAAGKLTFQTAAEAGKNVCWMTTSRDGSRLYAVNAREGSISTFDSTNASAPKPIQKLVLNDLGPVFTDAMGMQKTSSAPFQESLDSGEKVLYVVTQRQSVDPSYTRGNAIHILDVQADGMLKERPGDVPLDVPESARAQGIVVF